MIKTHILPILSDNYTYILESDNGDIAIIDPGAADPILKFLEAHNLSPTHILLTHHHADHIAGVKEILTTHTCRVYGPAAEAEKIKLLDETLDATSALSFGGEPVEIIETPGHTLGQINYHFQRSKKLFSGDALFVMGCGRVFEGTMEQMHTSLQKLKLLPDDTKIYCGHEYTLANAEFGVAHAPDNQNILNKYEIIKGLRANGEPTIPSTILEEKQTNVFLRAESIEEFTKLRKAKDTF